MHHAWAACGLAVNEIEGFNVLKPKHDFCVSDL